MPAPPGKNEETDSIAKNETETPIYGSELCRGIEKELAVVTLRNEERLRELCWASLSVMEESILER